MTFFWFAPRPEPLRLARTRLVAVASRPSTTQTGDRVAVRVDAELDPAQGETEEIGEAVAVADLAGAQDPLLVGSAFDRELGVERPEEGRMAAHAAGPVLAAMVDDEGGGARLGGDPLDVVDVLAHVARLVLGAAAQGDRERVDHDSAISPTSFASSSPVAITRSTSPVRSFRRSSARGMMSTSASAAAGHSCLSATTRFST